MGLLTFKGGVHPYEGKELSMDKPIADLLPGKELVFLLSQHIGAPAKALVKKGDRVLVGQKIAEAGGYVSAPVHSSVSGTVKALEKRRNALGDMVDAVVVENDGLYEKTEFEKWESLEPYSNRQILERIQAAGVVGMGGAGFPTHVKLSPKDPNAIDYVLVNGSECEPYLTSDYRCMLEYPDELVGGLKCILRTFRKDCKGVICIEDNKPEAIRLLKEKVKDEPQISVAVMQTKYPEGAERSLIYAVTGRSINSRMLPADAGCIVDNVDTVISVYHAVMDGQPLYQRVFTVSGDAVSDPRNYRVPVGMPYSEIIEAAGGFKAQPEKIISGGPMMGFALFGTDIPVTKTSGAITCFLKDQVSRVKLTNCINCGRCLTACPEQLMPSKLATFSELRDDQSFEEYYGLECVECGSCSYICPAKRPLAAEIKTMRRTVMANKRKR